MRLKIRFFNLLLAMFIILALMTYSSSVIASTASSIAADEFGIPTELDAIITEDADNNAMLRVAHLISDAPAVDVLVNGAKVVDSAPYKGITTYYSLDPAITYNFTVVVEDTTTRVFDPVVTPLMANTYYTVAALGLLADSSQHPEIFVDDNTLATGAEDTKFRAIHAVPDVSLVDVNLTDGTPLFTSLDYNDSSVYATVAASSYDVGVYPDGSSSAAIGPATLDLYAGYVYTVFAIGTANTGDGASLELLISVDDTGASNVRVTHAVPDAPTVDILVNGSTAFNTLGFTQTTEYASLDVVNPANGVTYNAYNFTVIQTGTSNPAVIGPVVTPLENNTDYTIVAVGNLSTIEPLLLEDNNTAVDAGKSRIRVVHSSPNAPSVDITLADGTVLVSDLSFKEAGYIEVDAGSYDLQVRAAGTDAVVLDLPGISVEDSHVYSVFAMGYVLIPDTITETETEIVTTTQAGEDATVTTTVSETPGFTLLLIFATISFSIIAIRLVKRK